MYKLVIADDENEIRNGLANYFPWDTIGFEVVFLACHGKEAYDYIANHPVDVILSDIKMPIMSGLELCEKLYLAKRNIIIVLLSGYTDFEYAKQAISYQVREYIVKPTKYTQIVEVFSKLKLELDQLRLPAPKEMSSIATNCTNQSVAFMIKYTQEHLKTINLESVARQLYMNPYYLSKLFKSETGENFSDFVLQLRMQKAVEFMKDSNYKCYEIGELVGYNNPKNFARAFRKYYKMSPTEYKSLLAQALLKE